MKRSLFFRHTWFCLSGNGICVGRYFEDIASVPAPPVVEIQSQADRFLAHYLFFPPCTLMGLFSFNILSTWKLMSWDIFWNYLLTVSVFTPFGLLLCSNLGPSYGPLIFLCIFCPVFFFNFFYFLGRFQLLPFNECWGGNLFVCIFNFQSSFPCPVEIQLTYSVLYFKVYNIMTYVYIAWWWPQ